MVTRASCRVFSLTDNARYEESGEVRNATMIAKRSGFPSQRKLASSTPDRRAEHGESGNCHRVGVCKLGVGRLQHRPYETLPMSTKICATPVLVNASQARTGIMIDLQGQNIDAPLPAMNLSCCEFLAACAEEIPPVARRGEVPLADCTPRAVEGRVLFDPLREAPSAV